MRTRWKLTIITALFGFGLSMGNLIAPKDVKAQGPTPKIYGCYYSPPEPPACNYCLEGCNTHGQQCCDPPAPQ